MAVTKYLNPKYSEGGGEPKYLSVPSLVAGGGEEPDLSNYLAKDNTTEYTPTSEYHPATKKYVDDSISTQATNIISQITDIAPETLDTLNELAAALGDDPNFATTITSQIAGKANSVHTHAITDITGLVNNGDGTKFLADDGTYKEAGDKTNVLILSLENDLANGQKDSPVDAEISTALKDAISTGKACVIKSANSDILANLQQIGDNVTIVMEQISRVGQTFVAVNTSITVNTATNVISDYQTGAIVLETEGDGNKFLSNDGKYKEIPQPDLSNYLAKNNTTEFTPTEDYNPATKKYVDDKYRYTQIAIDLDENTIADIDFTKTNYIRFTATPLNAKSKYSIGECIIPPLLDNIVSHLEHNFTIKVENINISGHINISINKNMNRIECHLYYDRCVLTESEYSALGTTPNTDNVLYFVTPD